MALPPRRRLDAGTDDVALEFVDELRQVGERRGAAEDVEVRARDDDLDAARGEVLGVAAIGVDRVAATGRRDVCEDDAELLEERELPLAKDCAWVAGGADDLPAPPGVEGVVEEFGDAAAFHARLQAELAGRH